MRASRSRRPIIHVWRPSPEQERYGPDMIAESLGRSSWDRDPVLLDADRAARVLLIPAFDPEGMLTATRAGSATTIRVDAFSHSLWYSLNIPSEDAATDVGAPAVPWTAEATVHGERSDELWKALDAAVDALATGKRTERFGADGLTAHGVYVASGRATTFNIWGPEPDDPEGNFVHTMYAAATANITTDRAIAWFDQLKMPRLPTEATGVADAAIVDILLGLDHQVDEIIAMSPAERRDTLVKAAKEGTLGDADVQVLHELGVLPPTT